VRTCPKCGAVAANSELVFCEHDGERLADDDSPRDTPPLVPVGARLGGGEVVGARAPDELVVRTPSGELLTVAFGGVDDAEREAGALRRLGGAPPFPRVVDQGSDPRHGSYLVLSSPSLGAPRLAEVGCGLSLAQAFATLRGILDAAERVERTGLTWDPEADDLFLEPSSALALTRLRVARRLAPN
jgi:hypothetical protein